MRDSRDTSDADRSRAGLAGAGGRTAPRPAPAPRTCSAAGTPSTAGHRTSAPTGTASARRTRAARSRAATTVPSSAAGPPSGGSPPSGCRAGAPSRAWAPTGRTVSPRTCAAHFPPCGPSAGIRSLTGSVPRPFPTRSSARTSGPARGLPRAGRRSTHRFFGFPVTSCAGVLSSHAQARTVRCGVAPERAARGGGEVPAVGIRPSSGAGTAGPKPGRARRTRAGPGPAHRRRRPHGGGVRGPPRGRDGRTGRSPGRRTR